MSLLGLDIQLQMLEAVEMSGEERGFVVTF